jgi:hypothetical protein
MNDDQQQDNPQGTPPQGGQPQPNYNPRRRMQELQAIPDNQRTDAQWDELNELEIMLAAGNRERPFNPPQANRGGQPNQPRPAGNGGGGGGGAGRNRKFRHRNQKRGPQQGGPQGA